MNVKHHRKRIFGASILLLLTALAIFTVASAADGGFDVSGNYSLVIMKKFDANTPSDVLKEAEKLTYQFKIEGYQEKRNSAGELEKIPLNKTVEVSAATGWQSETLKTDGPYNVTVSELTNNIVLTVNGQDYNMCDSKCESDVLMTAPKPKRIELKNNAQISLSRPEEVNSTTWFRISNEPYENHPTSNFRPVNEIVKLEPGSEPFELKNLSAGVYTIEELKAPDGYSLLVGPRTEHVMPDSSTGKAVGKFYINGNPGRLTLTAGGAKDDGVTHYYIIERIDSPESDSEFVTRTVPIASEEQYIIDNLPKGTYTVTEHTYKGKSGYTLTVPQTSDKSSGTKKFSNFDSDNPTKPTLYYYTVGGDYIDNFQYGPIFKNGKKLSTTDTYVIRYKADWVQEDGSIKTSTLTASQAKVNTLYSVKKDGKWRVFVPNENNRFYVGVGNTSIIQGGYCQISWIEHTEHENSTTFSRDFESVNSKTVDKRGWMLFSKPETASDQWKDVIYYFNVTSADKSFETCTVTNEDGTPLESSDGILTSIEHGVQLAVKPGETLKLNGLEAGTYSIEETVKEDHPVGFTMEVVGDPMNVTTAETEQKITVYGPRPLTIRKTGPASCPEDERTYSFEITGPNSFTQIVTLKAGEATDIQLPSDGEYTITPMDDKAQPFKLLYTDSSTVNGPASGNSSGNSATITFTNVFEQGNYAYRYIHEYYLLDESGTYHYEGSTPITTILGRSENEEYSAIDVTQLPNFNGFEYSHFDEACGTVDGLPEAVLEQDLALPPNMEEPGPDEDAFAPDLNAPDSSKPLETEDSGTVPDSPADEESGIQNPPESPEDEENSTQNPPEPPANEDENSQNPPAPPIDENGDTETPSEPLENSSSYTDLPDGAVPYSDSPNPIVGADGIIIQGIGKDSENRDLTYKPDPDKDYITVTEDASQIIILRYYRNLSKEQTGSYKFIHVYYMRDDKGDHWEGISEIGAKTGILDKTYNASGIELVTRPTNFSVDGKQYTYVHDGRPRYGLLSVCDNDDDYDADGNPIDGYIGNGFHYRPDTNWNSVTATQDGNQIIILRYYRETRGSYNIVHEYYLREKAEEQSGVEESPDAEEGAGEAESEAVPSGDSGIQPLPYDDSASASDLFSGTMDTVDSDYIYTFEGVSEIDSFTAGLGSEHRGEEKDWELSFNSNQYTYHSVGYGEVDGESNYHCISGKEWAAATEEGDQIIILRYYREKPTEPPSSESKPKTGALKVTKTVTGTGGDKSLDFHFTVTLSDDTIHGKYGDMTFQKGIAKFTLKDGKSIIARGLPDGIAYTVDEAALEDYEAAFTGGSGSITAGSTVTAAFTNTYKPTEQTGSLKIVKTVSGGPPAALEQSYVFDITGPESFRETVTITGSGSYTLEHLKPGVYTVTEQAPAQLEGYVLTVTGGGTVHVAADELSETTITNTYKPEQPDSPQEPEEPEQPNLPDPGDPDSPDTITIVEDGVPKTYIKIWDPENEEWVYIPEEDVPLNNLEIPETGDSSALWAALAAGSLLGLYTLKSIWSKRSSK